MARWLGSRPQNAVLGLAASYILFLPLAGVVSGAVVVLLVLLHGPRQALVEVLLAIGLLALLTLLSGGTAMAVALAALLTFTPAFVLAAALGQWRSLTLTLQVTVIVAAGLLLGFYAVLGDPAAYWSNWLVNDAAPMLREMGLQQQASAIVDNASIVAQQMTVLFVFIMWSLYTFGLLLGHAMHESASEQKGIYGRFCDLNFGRVLALVMAVASVAAVISGAAWLQNFAFLLFVIFWIQGLAILHWLHAEGRIPAFVLFAVYAVIPLLSALPVIPLAVVGYTDAWFGYRTRAAAQ